MIDGNISTNLRFIEKNFEKFLNINSEYVKKIKMHQNIKFFKVLQYSKAGNHKKVIVAEKSLT